MRLHGRRRFVGEAQNPSHFQLFAWYRLEPSACGRPVRFGIRHRGGYVEFPRSEPRKVGQLRPAYCRLDLADRPMNGRKPRWRFGSRMVSRSGSLSPSPERERCLMVVSVSSPMDTPPGVTRCSNRFASAGATWLWGEESPCANPLPTRERSPKSGRWKVLGIQICSLAWAGDLAGLAPARWAGSRSEPNWPRSRAPGSKIRRVSAAGSAPAIAVSITIPRAVKPSARLSNVAATPMNPLPGEIMHHCGQKGSRSVRIFLEIAHRRRSRPCHSDQSDTSASGPASISTRPSRGTEKISGLGANDRASWIQKRDFQPSFSPLWPISRGKPHALDQHTSLVLGTGITSSSRFQTHSPRSDAGDCRAASVTRYPPRGTLSTCARPIQSENTPIR